MDSTPFEIITIDGDSASGKSSVADEIALRTGYTHWDSGVIFRTMGTLMEIYGIDLFSLCESLSHRSIMDTVIFNGQHVIHAGVDISQRIKSESCGLKAAELGKYEHFQRWFINYLKEKVEHTQGNCIVSGRIGGNIIFPYAKRKFFLKADLTTKAVRRLSQLSNNAYSTWRFEDIANSIKSRDDINSIIHYWDVTIPEESLVIDTSKMSLTQVVNYVDSYCKLSRLDNTLLH